MKSKKIAVIIDIKHITSIINLKSTKAFDYLVFKEKLDKIILTKTKNTIQFDLINNQYAVVYVLPTAIEKTITAEILNCMADVKLDCIVIDELFPENNKYFLNNKSFNIMAKWLIGKHFNAKESFIEVK
jgi:hypothetical protein